MFDMLMGKFISCFSNDSSRRLSLFGRDEIARFIRWPMAACRAALPAYVSNRWRCYEDVSNHCAVPLTTSIESSGCGGGYPKS